MESSLNLSPEMLGQAAKAPSAAALQALAQENDIILTAEQAATCYAQFHRETGALSDEELDNIAGGCSKGSLPPAKCKFCDCTHFVGGKKGGIVGWICENCDNLA